MQRNNSSFCKMKSIFCNMRCKSVGVTLQFPITHVKGAFIPFTQVLERNQFAPGNSVNVGKLRENAVDYLCRQRVYPLLC